MNSSFEKAKNSQSEKVLTAFPTMCKWFETETGKPNIEEAVAEVGKRFQRFQQSGTSSCEGCP